MGWFLSGRIKTDEVMSKLIQQAQPDGRATLNALSADQRREVAQRVVDDPELAELVDHDPDRGETIYARRL